MLKHVRPGSFMMVPTRLFTLAFGLVGEGAGGLDEASGEAAAGEAGEALCYRLIRLIL